MEKALTNRTTIARQALLVLGGSIILAISAHLSIPLLPVPVTFQTMALLLLAIYLGPLLACGATIAYLIEGALGAPVFANATGLTLGYLLAFPVAVLVAGYIAQKRSFSRILVAGLASALIILTCGTLYLIPSLGAHTAFKFGFAPFILVEIIKVLAVAVGVSLSARRSKKSA